MKYKADKEEYADCIGYALLNDSVEDTITNYFKEEGLQVSLIERHENADDKDDYNQPYKLWYIEQKGPHTDVCYFRLYKDNSWVTIWG
jgi:hypothetical protein